MSSVAKADGRIRIGNPLSRALHHYEIELRETLTRIGMEVDPENVLPNIEGVNGFAKLMVLWRGIRVATSAGRSNDSTLQLWPSTGLFESALWPSTKGRNAVIYHDPVPLSPQFGYGRIAHIAAKAITGPAAPFVVAHSADADSELARLFPRLDRANVYHPIRSEQMSSNTEKGRILVAGQYKPVRDLGMLARLGPALRKLGYRPRIVGRGWPTQIPGWEICSSFVHEEALNKELRAAMVVVLPYKRYFQSGISIRALEMGTVAVMPQTSFATTLHGSDSSAVVGEPENLQDWLRAIESVTTGGVDPVSTFDRYITRCDESWRQFLHRLMSE